MISLKSPHIYSCILFTIIFNFSFAQKPVTTIPFKLTVPIEPVNTQIDGTCKNLPNNLVSVEIKPNRSLPELLRQHIEDNINSVVVSAVPEITDCQNLLKRIKKSRPNWISKDFPSFPLDPEIVVYTFKLPKNNYYLLLKDQAKSSIKDPFYLLFHWHDGIWELSPANNEDITFYGMEGEHAITGYYEGPYFIKQINKIDNHHLVLERTEIWLNDQQIPLEEK